MRRGRSRKRAREFALKIWRGWLKPILTVIIVLGSFRPSIADWYNIDTEEQARHRFALEGIDSQFHPVMFTSICSVGVFRLSVKSCRVA